MRFNRRKMLEAENQRLRESREAQDALIYEQRKTIKHKDEAIRQLQGAVDAYVKIVKSCERRYKNLDAKYQQFLLWPDCSTCAKKFANVCAYPPGPNEPVRINCPHYTEAEVGK